MEKDASRHLDASPPSRSRRRSTATTLRPMATAASIPEPAHHSQSGQHRQPDHGARRHAATMGRHQRPTRHAASSHLHHRHSPRSSRKTRAHTSSTRRPATTRRRRSLTRSSISCTAGATPIPDGLPSATPISSSTTSSPQGRSSRWSSSCPSATAIWLSSDTHDVWDDPAAIDHNTDLFSKALLTEGLTPSGVRVPRLQGPQRPSYHRPLDGRP